MGFLQQSTLEDTHGAQTQTLERISHHETPLNLTPTKTNHNKAQPFGLLVELELSRIATPP